MQKIVKEAFQKITYLKQLMSQGIIKPTDISTVYEHFLAKNQNLTLSYIDQATEIFIEANLSSSEYDRPLQQLSQITNNQEPIMLKELIKEINVQIDKLGIDTNATFIDFLILGFITKQILQNQESKQILQNQVSQQQFLPILIVSDIFQKFKYINQLINYNILTLNDMHTIYNSLLNNSQDLTLVYIGETIQLCVSNKKMSSQQRSTLDLINRNIEMAKIIEQTKQLNQSELSSNPEVAEEFLEDFQHSEAEEIQDNDECPICYDQFNGENEEYIIHQCGHSFHKTCLSDHLKSGIDAHKFPLKCPGEDCQTDIIMEELQQNLDYTDLEKFQIYSLNAYIDMHSDEYSWCPTSNCNYAFLYEKNAVSQFTCPKCSKHYCLNCRAEYHVGMSCKEFKINNKFDQNDQKLLDFVKGQKFKQCTNCKFWVGKNQGCDHMTCRCGHQFCYICGQKYGTCICNKRN